jgi:hypothetical protein
MLGLREGIGEGGGGRGDRGLIVIGRLQELIPTITLDAKLLLGSPYLARSIGVEVGLFELLNECVYVGSGGGDEGLFAGETREDGGVGIDSDGPVEVVVAVLELLYERDGLLVGGSELSPHRLLVGINY